MDIVLEIIKWPLMFVSFFGGAWLVYWFFSDNSGESDSSQGPIKGSWSQERMRVSLAMVMLTLFALFCAYLMFREMPEGMRDMLAGESELSQPVNYMSQPEPEDNQPLNVRQRRLQRP